MPSVLDKVEKAGFNSRTCEGATSLWLVFSTIDRVSIHAPVKVRLTLRGVQELRGGVSIHAPVKVRHIVRILSAIRQEFQFTHL